MSARSATSTTALAIALAAWLGASACIAPSVLDERERGVETREAELDWRPAVAQDVPGTWSASVLEGPLAASVWALHYRFEADGAYTGAALLAEDPPRYAVLSGSWTLTDSVLRLDDAEPAAARAAGESAARQLELSGAQGAIVLTREVVR